MPWIELGKAWLSRNRMDYVLKCGGERWKEETVYCVEQLTLAWIRKCCATVRGISSIGGYFIK